MASHPPIDFAWRIVSYARHEARLHALGEASSFPARTKFAHLFSWRGVERPRFVAWVVTDKVLSKAIAKEADEPSHPLARWLARQPRIDPWVVAMGWTFYWQHLMQPSQTAWETQIRRRHPPHAWLDRLLEPSRGWLLWDFQLQLLAESSSGCEKIPAWVGAKVRQRNPRSLRWLESALLPTGESLQDVVEMRGHPGRGCTVPFCGQVATRIHALIDSKLTRRPWQMDT